MSADTLLDQAAFVLRERQAAYGDAGKAMAKVAPSIWLSKMNFLRIQFIRPSCRQSRLSPRWNLCWATKFITTITR